jgi:hypothetical protein
MTDKPLYNSKDFEEFCEAQKTKGLHPKYWCELPRLWQEELDFRKELEDALVELPLGL